LKVECAQPSIADMSAGQSMEGLYDPVLEDSEREAVADLLGYLENVHLPQPLRPFEGHHANVWFSESRPIFFPETPFGL
jgi:hypothetical protein